MEKNLQKAIWTAKLGILSYLTFLFVHVIIDHYWEIYPSLVFPGFTNAPIIRDSVTLSFVDFYAITSDNKRVEIPKKAFFDSLYPKHAPFLLNTMIKKGNTVEKNAEYLGRLVNFEAYARLRLKATFPHHTFNTLHVSKYRRKVDVLHGLFSAQKELQTKITLAL